MKVRGKAGNVKAKKKIGSGGEGDAGTDPAKGGPHAANRFGNAAYQPPKGKPNYGSKSTLGGRIDQSFRAPGGRGGGSGGGGK